MTAKEILASCDRDLVHFKRNLVALVVGGVGLAGLPR
jgi:hypothetical protein